MKDEKKSNVHFVQKDTEPTEETIQEIVDKGSVQKRLESLEDSLKIILKILTEQEEKIHQCSIQR